MTPLRLIDTTALQDTLVRFVAERDWGRYHSPKNLAMALTGEVGELVELFQWLTEDQSREVMKDPVSAQAVRDEVADVLIYLMELVTALGMDLNQAVVDKLASNARRYPPLPGRGAGPRDPSA